MARLGTSGAPPSRTRHEAACRLGRGSHDTDGGGRRGLRRAQGLSCQPRAARPGKSAGDRPHRRGRRAAAARRRHGLVVDPGLRHHQPAIRLSVPAEAQARGGDAGRRHPCLQQGHRRPGCRRDDGAHESRRAARARASRDLAGRHQFGDPAHPDRPVRGPPARRHRYRQIAGRQLRADEPAICSRRRGAARRRGICPRHGRGGPGEGRRPVQPLRHHARLVQGRHALLAVRHQRRPASQRLRAEVHRQAPADAHHRHDRPQAIDRRTAYSTLRPFRPGEGLMKRRFVDLSIYLENDVISDPAPFGPKIQYHKHENTAGQIASFFPGLKKEDLPDGQGWAVENVNLSTHNGTHLDAPYHFHPTMNKGERAITIDEVPLDWCFQPGVKLDFRAMADGHVITAKEVEEELKRIGHELKPLEIVVVNTRAGSRYGNSDYVNSGCGMGYDATMFLLEKGIRLTGTDAWSWDAPFYFTAQKWAKDHDPSIIWEGHKAGRDIGYCHLEKLHNLEALPGDGFTISCFPHKIRGASAGWTRAVAIFEE